MYSIYMKKAATILFLLMAVLTTQAQIQDPIHVKSELKTGKGAEAEIVFTVTIDAGWHVYSTVLPKEGPLPTSFNTVKMEGVQTVGKLTPVGNAIRKYDELFSMELTYFESAVKFVQKVKFTRPEYSIDCFLEYAACNDRSCIPPAQVEFKAKGKSPAVDKEPAATAKEEKTDVSTADASATASTDTAAAINTTTSDTTTTDTTFVAADGAEADLYAPVIDELHAAGGSESLASRPLLYILLMGFIGGLLAVAMPCIWPIIPMTVSFFLKRAKTDRKKGIRDAFTYGVSIIGIYLGLGILVTALFGPDTLNAMSTNAVFNIFLFLLLVAFALSFFGWFEIKLPDGWANAVDTKASATSGLLSIFLMAFTLVLVSFSCTAPIIGLLLVETTTSGNWLAPAMGMLGFAVALALPFTLFAMFPSWLKQIPKSGSWMNTLKVVLGFIELAFALKFFSVADLAYGWHLMDREVFLALWIVIFAFLGAYLCGWLKFQSDEVGGNLSKPMPVVCIMGGLMSLAFAVYMVPGLWGAPCKAVSAFAPPMNTQDFNLNTKTVEARFTDYDQGMAAARAEGKPVFLDFTGFGCVNCRKMEAAVWTDPRVADRLRNDFVLISLYVDDKTPLPQPIEVTDEQGNTRTLRTVGAKWSYLQSHKFGANAQPFYVILDPATGKPLSGSRAYDEDIDAYLRFMDVR
jgi:thiol:disulfide interchange protein